MQFHNEVAAFSLEQGTSSVEVFLLLLFEALNLQIGACEVIKGDLGHFFNIHNFMNAHAIIICIFFEIVGICVVMVLHTF